MAATTVVINAAIAAASAVRNGAVATRRAASRRLLESRARSGNPRERREAKEALRRGER